MNKKIILLFILMVGIFSLIAFLVNYKNSSLPSITSLEKQKKISVVTSFYPLYDFTKNITGDYASVINITPSGAEPHDYEPTPQDIIRIQNADIFIFNGNGVDIWAEKITPELISKGIVVIKMSDSIPPTLSIENDPHFWLDPISAQAEVHVIADALKKADTKNTTSYSQNEEKYLTALTGLHHDYEKALTSCASRKVITSHNAFSYLATRYNLENHYISGLSPEDEPSAKQMAIITEIAKKENVRYIFFETLVDPELSQTIASEIGAETLILNPIESLSSNDIATGKDYISEMRENLKNLKTALSCQ